MLIKCSYRLHIDYFSIAIDQIKPKLPPLCGFYNLNSNICFPIISSSLSNIEKGKTIR